MDDGGGGGRVTLGAVRCVAAGLDRAEKVASLLAVFIAEEPLLRAASVNVEDVRPKILPWATSILSRGLSVVAVDDSKGGEVVGVLTGFAVGDDQPEDAKLLLNYWFPHPGVAAIEHLIDELESESKLLEKYGVASMAIAGHLAVATGYRGAGLGAALVLQAMELALSRGVKLLAAAATGCYSQALFRRLQFNAHAEAEYEKTLDGQLFDVSQLGSHRAMIVFAKMLSRSEIGAP